jgi:hypothetical protein
MKNACIAGICLGVLLLAGCQRNKGGVAPSAAPPTVKAEGASSSSSGMTPTPTVAEKSLPKPVAVFLGREEYLDSRGEAFIRYRFAVPNWNEFSNELFVSAPELPPCGLNQRSARTWVDLYGDGARIYGFCALESSQSLGDQLSFAIAKGKKPPRKFFLRLHDRKLNRFTQSEVIDLPE